MSKVKITVTSSKCRGGYCKAGDEFIVDDLCPPMCHELWNEIYPMVYALKNGATQRTFARLFCLDMLMIFA